MSGKGQQHPPSALPLMAQNGGGANMMMMQHAQHLQHMQQHHLQYPAGYQLPPSAYPSAPGTPGLMMGGGGAGAPPPTVIYPHAPSMGPIGYPGGYASGASTPSLARSPARSRKAAGMDVASEWLAARHSHLSGGGPGTPSTYSRAGSVMSNMTTATGMNDDAISVVSTVVGGGGGDLMELQPATSHHQAENVDPAATARLEEQARQCAAAIVAPEAVETRVRAAFALKELLSQLSPDRLSKPTLDMIIDMLISGLQQARAQQIDNGIKFELFHQLFRVMHELCGGRPIRLVIAQAATQRGLFTEMVDTACVIINFGQQSSKLVLEVVCFLNLMARDEGTDHYRVIKGFLRENKDVFSAVFFRMICTHLPTFVEFVCRLLRFGNRRVLREKITPEKVQLLVAGRDKHEGLLRRNLRKASQGTDKKTVTNVLTNALKIVELLVRNDGDKRLEHEDAIQKAFIDQNIIGYLGECLRLAEHSYVDDSLRTVAALAASPHISDTIAEQMAGLMVSYCLTHVRNKVQCAVMFTLTVLTAKREPLQRKLANTNAFNYACHLIKNYANPNSLQAANEGDMGLLENALQFMLRQLALSSNDEGQRVKLWTDEIKPDFMQLLFDPALTSALLNVLVSGGGGAAIEQLRAMAIQVMAAVLTLKPIADRYRATLGQAFDGQYAENVAAAVVRSASEAMTAGRASPIFLSSVVDVLLAIIEDPLHAAYIGIQARSSSAHFPLNVLFSHALVDETMTGKLLLICNQLIKDKELQQTWAGYRDKFNALSCSGNYDISQAANEIVSRLGFASEGENDFTMCIANSLFRSNDMQL